MIPIQRRPRVPPVGSTAPAHLLREAEASLRAAAVYAHVLHDRFELARCTSDPTRLGELHSSLLLHLVAVSEAFQTSVDHALAQIERELATSARMVATTARETVPAS